MATRKKKTAPPLVIAEDMTIYNAAAQKQRLLDALQGTDRLEIDLSAVGEIDTAGFQLLVLVKREARRLDKEAQIVAHSRIAPRATNRPQVVRHSPLRNSQLMADFRLRVALKIELRYLLATSFDAKCFPGVASHLLAPSP